MIGSPVKVYWLCWPNMLFSLVDLFMSELWCLLEDVCVCNCQAQFSVQWMCMSVCLWVCDVCTFSSPRVFCSFGPAKRTNDSWTARFMSTSHPFFSQKLAVGLQKKKIISFFAVTDQFLRGEQCQKNKWSLMFSCESFKLWLFCSYLWLPTSDNK